MKRFVLSLVLVGVLSGLTVASTSADPGSNNPKVQYRTFTCSDGNTYHAGFVGIAADFFLVDSTSIFALKSFTTISPSGEVQTFNYGIKGFDPSTLLTCSYTDPSGAFNIFEGFVTPMS
jgi:hypothetical protein